MTRPWTLGALASFLLAALLYLAPLMPLTGSIAPGHYVGDGADPLSAPFTISAVRTAYRDDPMNWLKPAVRSDQLNLPEPYWIQVVWIERFWIVLTDWAGVSTLGTHHGFILLMFALNFGVFFALSRSLGQPLWVSVTASLVFAFCPFTRARVTAHAAVAGIYALPATLLLVQALTRARAWKALGWGLLIAISAPQWILLSALLFPFALWAEGLSRTSARPLLKTLILSQGLPLLLIATWFMPLPSLPRHGADGATEAYVRTYIGVAQDFFTSDIKWGEWDWNPIRESLNRARIATLGNGNAHESAQGIRYLVWFLGLMGLFTGLKRGLPWIAFASMCTVFFLSIDASLWLSGVIQGFRVPARFGIGVHFALCLGLTWSLTRINTLARSHKARIGMYLLGCFVVLEYLPSGPLFTQPWSYRLGSLTRADGNCGQGVLLPYVSHSSSFAFYQAIQGIAETRCKVINRMHVEAEDEKLSEALSLEYASMDPTVSKLIQCLELDFVAFSPQFSEARARDICSELGFEWSAVNACRKKQGERLSETLSFELFDRCLNLFTR